MKFPFIIFFSVVLVVSRGQARIDSLENIISKTTIDTVRINCYNNLSFLLSRKDPEKSEKYAGLALELSKRISYNKGIAFAYFNEGALFRDGNQYEKAFESFRNSLSFYEMEHDLKGIWTITSCIGNVYGIKGDYKQALDYHLKALKYCDTLNDRASFASTQNNIAIVYTYMGFLDKSLEAHLIALSIRDSLKDLQGASSSLLNIGITYDKLGNSGKALEYNQKAIEAKEKIGDKRGLAAALGNMGATYDYLNNYEKATEYYLKAMVIQEELNDLYGLSNSMVGIAGMNELKGKYPVALKYYQQALQVKNDLGDADGIAQCHLNIALLHEKTGHAELALENFLLAEKISLETNSRFSLKAIYEGMAASYFSMGKFKEAYQYIKVYTELKDSIFNNESNEQIAEIQTKYETEKKELQIDNLNKNNAIKEAEIRKQNFQKLAFATGFVLMFLLAFIVFRGYRQKQKINQIITIQKKEVEKQKEIVDLKNKSLETAYNKIEEKNQEILDSIHYAKRIQEAILPPQKLVKQHLEKSFILYKPKDIVAGDFYWMETIPGKVLFASVDCTGHGVPGAFMSILGFNGLNRCVKEFGLTQPAAILDKLCELVDEAFSKSEADIKDGMDIALCSFDYKNNTLEFSGAGNSLYFIRKNSLIEYKADKQPVGKFSNRKPFTNHLIQAQQNDAIYIFTDGYADQFGGPKGKKFKYRQFEELLLSIQDKSMTEQREVLNNSIENWKGDLSQIDDICIIGVKI